MMKTFTRILLSVSFLFLVLPASAQFSTPQPGTSLISVPFNNGAIGTVGSNTQKCDTVTLFSTLNIERVFFQQWTDNGSFQVQGNDIFGVLRIKIVNGGNMDIPGSIIWRITSDSTIEHFGFLMDVGSYNLNSATNGPNFPLTGGLVSSTANNWSLQLVSSNYIANKPVADGDNISGNAAGVLADLNVYLAEAQDPNNKPGGPVAITCENKTTTTPTFSGTVTLDEDPTKDDELELFINGVSFVSADAELTVTANGAPSGTLQAYNWSLSVPGSVGLSVGQTHTITAVVSNVEGYTLEDACEFSIIDPAVKLLFFHIKPSLS